MNALEFARLQFGITTVFHFIFVPTTIGLALFVAVCQTRYQRTGDERFGRMTRFWGKVMLISFAVGVVTGIVQEFQFGMNWSTYSKYVGDIFGAPLAMEGLAAFFVESTFLGLWLFGRGRLSPRVHLATIWAVAASTALSAFFIMAANSWMQHPVGFAMNPATHRPQLTSIWDVLGNSTLWTAFPHVIFAAFTTGGMLVVGVSAYQLRRGRNPDVFGRSLRMALPAVAVGVVLTMVVGHFQGDLLEDQQPIKMASADAVFENEKPAGLSLFATGAFTRNPHELNRNVEIPHLLSIIATNDWNGEVRGINPLEAEYRKKYGPGDYVPVVAVTYWTWRGMMGAGILIFVVALAGLWLARRGKVERSRRFLWIAIWAAALPFIANTAGWVFTEMGRQPWIVQGLLRTNQANSPAVSTREVVVTLVGYTVIYGALIIVAGGLFVREVREGADTPFEKPPSGDEERDPDLSLAY